MLKNVMTFAVIGTVFAGVATTSVGSARADWQGDAMMAAGMASVAAGAAAALAGGEPRYHRSSYRPPCYRARPVYNCCGERIGWRRVPAY